MHLILIFLSFNIHADTNNCVSTHFDEKAEVENVIDGDTVILSDGRHVRMIGINTPEIGRDGKLDDVGAIVAKQKLEELVNSTKSVGLIYDDERFDRFDRTLAHLYLTDGTNLQAEILNSGLAFPLTIPPNLGNLDCYYEQVKRARTEERGLWRLPEYQSHHVSSLAGVKNNFIYLNGRVVKVTESRSSIWINLENNVALRLVKDDLIYFNLNRLKSLKDKMIEAKGWLYKKKGQFRLRIRHPVDINIIDNKKN